MSGYVCYLGNAQSRELVSAVGLLNICTRVKMLPVSSKFSVWFLKHWGNGSGQASSPTRLVYKDCNNSSDSMFGGGTLPSAAAIFFARGQGQGILTVLHPGGHDHAILTAFLSPPYLITLVMVIVLEN
ncbi:hypothetical protein RRG08_033710 [Elysia crispata]|uniref:Uncharacterized protein n=1 Tax=Elysia crispata TaxID=231223 RepID=A0AAE1A9H0_9GAST|nr:hypothetical protein RRG08_033710 [Elysia crispata]